MSKAMADEQVDQNDDSGTYESNPTPVSENISSINPPPPTIETKSTRYTGSSARIVELSLNQ
jgi:hypothetical protein